MASLIAPHLAGQLCCATRAKDVALITSLNFADVPNLMLEYELVLAQIVDREMDEVCMNVNKHQDISRCEYQPLHSSFLNNLGIQSKCSLSVQRHNALAANMLLKPDTHEDETQDEGLATPPLCQSGHCLENRRS